MHSKHWSDGVLYVRTGSTSYMPPDAAFADTENGRRMKYWLG